MHFCNLCNISCPSDYQMDAHLRGRKHAQQLRWGEPSAGRCFYFPNCFKGDSCPYSHETFTEEDAPTSAAIVSPTISSSGSDDDDVVTAVSLSKGGDNPNKGLAPIFAPPVKKKKFPAEYRNIFYRKRNVNLYIRNGLVVWEFSYNPTVIRAIKENIKGRTYDPSTRTWNCPLESLPDSIALYKHMGRTTDADLEKRAKEIVETHGASAADAIKLGFRFPPGELGTVSAQLLYDADVVAAIKMIPPTLRAYEPGTKTWTMNLLSFPSLLEFLSPLGYTPSSHLTDIAKAVQAVEQVLESGVEEDKPSVTDTATCKSVDNDLEGLKSDLSEAHDFFVEELEGAESDLAEAQDFFEVCHPVSEGEFDASSIEESQSSLLLTKINQLIAVIKKDDEPLRTSFDRSDCGQSKRRRLSSSQEDWAMKMLGRNNKKKISKNPSDCDCGRPYKRTAGQHLCRYFGTFECNCGNGWTSAYCWKGETQACRSCNHESLPTKKEQLDGRVRFGGDGAHDSLRCAMCAKLGYNCSRF